MSTNATIEDTIHDLVDQNVQKHEAVLYNPGPTLPAVKVSTRNNYTKAEDDLIMDLAMQFPDNLNHGFKQVAKKLKGRKTCSISARYYYLVRKDGKKSVTFTGSAVGFTQKKITQSRNGKLLRTEPLQPIIVMFKQLLDMNPAERKKILAFLKTIEE